MIPTLIAEYPDDFAQDDCGDIQLTFENVAEMEKVCELARAAYKRSFDSEEHTCEICQRSLLGEKFTFLTSC